MQSITRQSSSLDALCEGLSAASARLKYGSSKALMLLSEQAPELLYPRFDFFAGLLASDFSILRWNATRILGNLATVDHQNKLEHLFDRYFAPILGDELVAAANAIGSASVIALAKPYLADRIARKILQVSRASYRTPECCNVAIGHAIQSLDRFFSLIQKRKPVLEFVQAQLENPRPATRKKAQTFLKRWAGPADKAASAQNA
jgi:hypothetical protein